MMTLDCDVPQQERDEAIPEDRSPFGRIALLAVYNSGNPLAPDFRQERDFILFAGRNEEGHLLLGYLAEVGETPSCLDRGRTLLRTERWLYAPVSEETVAQLEAGTLEVSHPFCNPDYGFIYEIIKENGTITMVNRRFRDLPPRGLPTFVYLAERPEGVFVTDITPQALLVCRQLLRQIQVLRNEWSAEVVMSFDEAN